MSITKFETLKENKIPVDIKNVVYKRENPSYLVLSVERHDSSVEVNLKALYQNGYRYCSLGSFSVLATFASKEDIERLVNKAEEKAEEFRKKTLDILIKSNYRLYLPDEGKMDLFVNGKSWRVPDNLAFISS